MIGVGDGKESQEEFDQLLLAFREHHQPEGLEEEMLVEIMAVSHWRRARALRCELGEIRVRLDDGRSRHARDSQSHLSGIKHFVGVLDSAYKSLETTSAGIDYLCSIVEDVKSEVIANSDLSEEQLRRIVQHFGADNEFALCCVGSSAVAANCARQNGKLKDERPFSEFSDADRIAIITRAAEIEKERLAGLKKMILQKEAIQLEARLKTLSLPSKDEMDRLIRYETMYERQYYRARDRLERLQRLRQGETVPAPVTVHLAEGN